MSEPTFKTWGLEDSPISIEYSLVVLEEIRQEVNQGLQRIARGGIEVGGVMYGVCDGRKVRIEAMRPVACSHSQGPAFVLSEEDRAALEQQLQDDLQDPHLDGLVCVGWFVSHNRGEMALTEQDAQIFTDCFPDAWQVTLLVRPGRAAATKAAFFVKESDGGVRIDRPYQEFEFPDRLAGVLDRVAKRERPVESRRGFRELPPLGAGAIARGPQAVPSAVPPPVPPNDGFQYGQSLGTTYGAQSYGGSTYMEGQRPMPSPDGDGGLYRKLVTGLVALIVLLAAGAGYFYYKGDLGLSKPQTIGLVMTERAGRLQIEWNPFAKPISTALKGDLEVVDGGQSQVFPLLVADLNKGQYSYARKSGDVEVRMTVRGSDGVVVSEASRFLGQQPTAVVTPETQELKALDDKKSELEAEIARLRAANAAQAERIAQLQRNLTLMQTRLGIQQAAEPQ